MKKLKLKKYGPNLCPQEEFHFFFSESLNSALQNSQLIKSASPRIISFGLTGLIRELNPICKMPSTEKGNMITGLIFHNIHMFL